MPMSPEPLAYLITFRTYGTWLHGDERGSVDREHNIPGTPLFPPDPRRETRRRSQLKHTPVELDADRRAVVRRTILEVAEHRNWEIHTLAVRSNHVHIVITAYDTPERVMTSLKAWCTRRLIAAGLGKRGTKVWSRHGSTRYLWNPDDVEAACRYLCERQGEDLSE